MRLLLFLLPVLCAAAPPLPLHVGEALTFRVSWALFPNAGEIKVFAQADAADGKPQVTVTTLTTTRGLLGKLYKFDARSDAVFDAATGRMIIHTEKSFSGKKSTSNAMQFNYAKGTADYVDLLNSAKNLTVPLPVDPPLDLITSLLQTRTWDLKPGETRDASVIFEEEIYQLTLHALRYETITTPLGTYNTLVYEPRMEKTPPRGMFKKGSTVRVWISQDDEHLPVRFQVDFNFGAGVATLMSYEHTPSEK